MPFVLTPSRRRRQPLALATRNAEFAWDVLVNQATPYYDAARRTRVTPRGAQQVSRHGVWRNWHGVNALEQIQAPLPTTATGYTILWVGPFNVASTGAGVSMIRTTGGGFRFEPYTTAGGVWMTATHTGVVGLNPIGPWSYVHDARPWAVIISYDGTTATFEALTPNNEYAFASTTASMSAGTGTIDLSATSGVFGAYVVGYARRPMPAGMRRRILDNPWSLFEPEDRRGFFSVGAGAADLVVSDAAHAHLLDGITLTQAHALTVGDAAHAHAADTVELTQQTALAPADAVHGHAADGLALTQQHALALADAVHAHTSEQPTLSTAGDLAIAEALQAHAADGITLTQAHSLAVADALHGHAADAITLGGAGGLAIDDALQAHLAESLALTQAHFLIISDAVHQHLADQLAVALPGTLVADSDRVLVMKYEGRTLVLLRASRVLSVAPAARSLSVH